MNTQRSSTAETLWRNLKKLWRKCAAKWATVCPARRELRRHIQGGWCPTEPDASGNGSLCASLSCVLPSEYFHMFCVLVTACIDCVFGFISWWCPDPYLKCKVLSENFVSDSYCASLIFIWTFPLWVMRSRVFHPILKSGTVAVCCRSVPPRIFFECHQLIGMLSLPVAAHQHTLPLLKHLFGVGTCAPPSIDQGALYVRSSTLWGRAGGAPGDLWGVVCQLWGDARCSFFCFVVF